MKGIVAQIEGKYAVILTQDGSFQKVRAKPYMETGVEIDMDQPSEKFRNTRFAMKVTSIAAAALLALGTGYGAYCYTVPYSYVHLDINPSIELTANVYDRIIKAEALNEDGQKLLKGRNLKHVKIDEGVSDLLGAAVQEGYLADNTHQAGDAVSSTGEDANTSGNGSNASGGASDNAGDSTNPSNKIPPQGNDNAVLLTISSNSSKKSGILKKEITDTASKELDNDKVDSEILVGEASMEQRNEARELGVTPGKLALIEDALEDEPELQLDDLKKNSVKELLKIIQRKKNQEKSNSESKTGTDVQGAKSGVSANNPDNTAQKENTAFPENPGKGKDREKTVGNGQPQNNSQNNGQDRKPGSERNKIRQPGSGKTQPQNNNAGKDTNKGEQTGTLTGTGSAIGNDSKKNDEADRNTARRNANELKKEREQLRNDLLNQMEKQIKERINKLKQQRNMNSDNNKDGVRSNLKENRKQK